MEKLIEVKADVNFIGIYGETPLWVAVSRGHTDVVEKLLAAKDIDVNKARKDGETPLLSAAANDHTEIVTLLLKAGADESLLTEEQQNQFAGIIAAAKMLNTARFKLALPPARYQNFFESNEGTTTEQDRAGYSVQVQEEEERNGQKN